MSNSDIPYEIKRDMEETARLKRLLGADDDEAREEMKVPLQLLAWCREAYRTRAEPYQEQNIEEEPGQPPPKFPSGMVELDERTGGGGYAYTCIAANPKCGKSMLAMSMALEAAKQGWRVWYLNAELSEYEIINRVRRFYGGKPPPWSVAKNFTMLHTERGMGISHLLTQLERQLSINDTRWLVVVDSINRVVFQSKQKAGENEHWRVLEEWSEFFRMASKLSGGKIASVIVSELNSQGHVKGGMIEYAADLVVKITSAGKSNDGYFKVSIPYARSSGGGPLGKFWLNWKEGRFVYLGDNGEESA